MGVSDGALATRLAVLLTEMARSRVLKDGGVFLLLLFVFGVKVFQKVLCSYLLARLMDVFGGKRAASALDCFDAQVI